MDVDTAMTYSHDVGFDEGYQCGYEDGYADAMAEMGGSHERVPQAADEGAVD